MGSVQLRPEQYFFLRLVARQASFQISIFYQSIQRRRNRHALGRCQWWKTWSKPPVPCWNCQKHQINLWRAKERRKACDCCRNPLHRSCKNHRGGKTLEWRSQPIVACLCKKVELTKTEYLALTLELHLLLFCSHFCLSQCQGWWSVGICPIGVRTILGRTKVLPWYVCRFWRSSFQFWWI